MPCLDAINPASHPETRSTPDRQRDRFSSVASSLNHAQTVHETNTYLPPGPNSFYNTPSQLDDYVMGTDKRWSQSPRNLDFYRTSTTTNLFHYRNVPVEVGSSVMDPLHDNPTNNGGLGLREQLEACAECYYSSGFQPQGIAHGSGGRKFPTDAPPSNQNTPQRPGSTQNIGSQPTHYSGDNVRPTAPPGQAYSTSFDFNYAAPPQIFDPSYVPDPLALSPKIKSEYCEPLGLPADSGILTTCCPTWNVPKDIKSEPLDTYTPLHQFRNVSESNDFESPTSTPVPRPRRRRRRRSPTTRSFKAVDYSNTATSPSPPPPPPSPPPDVAGVADSSTTLTPGRPIEYDPNVTYPEHSNNNVENKDDPDAFLRSITTLYDDTQPLRGDSQTVDFGAPEIPIIKKEHVPEAFEPGAAESSANQPAGDVSSEQKAVTQGKKRKRKRSDAISTEPEQYHKAKKPRTRKTPNSVPRPISDDPRRRNPVSLYFCVNWDCRTSLNPAYAFKGLKTKEDAQRHLLVHGPDRFFCGLCNNYSYKRADHFRE